MKLTEITNKKSLIKPSEIDKKGDQIKLPNAYDNVNYGKKTGIKNKTVTVKDTHTGKVYGRRTLKGKTTGGKGLREFLLHELYYNKPQEIDMLLNLLDDAEGMEQYDDVIQLLQRNKVRTDHPDNTYQDLLASDENVVHKLMKQTKEFVKGTDRLHEPLSEL